MKTFSSIFLLLAFAFLLGGCRCMRNSSFSLDRSDTASLDLSARSFSFLRDTLAERQTIRIEYWYPYELGSGDNIMDRRQADTTTTASKVGGAKPSGSGGGVPAIKSIEITSERNAGKTGSKIDSTSLSSKKSIKESEQKEKSSETKPDQGSVFSSTLAIGLIIVVVVVLLFTVGKKYLKVNFPWIFTIKDWLNKMLKQ